MKNFKNFGAVTADKERWDKNFIANVNLAF